MSFTIMKDILMKNWPLFLRGASVTLFISVIGTIIGAMIGLLVGLVRTTPIPEKGGKRVIYKITNRLLVIYIEFFRGTPMMVQAAVMFYGFAEVFGIRLNRIFAAIFIVSVNTGAYMAEIVRGFIPSSLIYQLRCIMNEYNIHINMGYNMLE